jgi:hypothetical protein
VLTGGRARSMLGRDRSWRAVAKAPLEFDGYSLADLRTQDRFDAVVENSDGREAIQLITRWS